MIECNELKAKFMSEQICGKQKTRIVMSTVRHVSYCSEPRKISCRLIFFAESVLIVLT